MNAKGALADAGLGSASDTLEVVFSVPSGSWPASITNYSAEQAADLVDRFSDEGDYHFFIASIGVW